MDVITRRANGFDTEALFRVRTGVRENYQSRDELAGLGVTPESVRAILADENHSSWVAQAQGKIVGFSITDLLEGYVFALFLLPEFEGYGIGRKLMELTERDACLAGKTALWLSTGNDPFLRAYGFYQKLGWRTDGFLADGQVVFRKQLPMKPDNSD